MSDARALFLSNTAEERLELLWILAHREKSFHNAVIRVYDAAGNVIETHKHAGDFRGMVE
jgi:hypothetical protein